MKTIFKVLILIFQFNIASYAWFSDDFKPRIDINYTIVLSSPMIKALNDYDSEFKIYQARHYATWARRLYDYKSYESWSGSYMGYQTPSAVIGDFNGDKIADIAVSGVSKKYRAVLVLISNGQNYKVIAVNKGMFEKEYNFNFFFDKKAKSDMCASLELMPRGETIRAEPAYNRPEIKLKTDAFTYGGEKGSGLYIYENGNFTEYIMSD